MAGEWDPAQYNRFASEREQPFWDLVGLLRPVDAPRLVDLGCGDGRLTAQLHDRLGAVSTLGVDASRAMLEDAAAHATADVTFEDGDISTWRGSDLDIVFANASLQWVSDHASVLARWRDALAPGGQIAVQVPSNADHQSHLVSTEIAAGWLGDAAPPDFVAHNVLAPEVYAETLHTLGFAEQHVRLQVYGHHLESTASIVEWVKGTSLVRFKEALGDRFDEFVAEYRAELLRRLGDRAPYFYAFKRILLWGRLG